MEAIQEIISEIVRDTNIYLDDLQRADRLWNELEGHLLTSYLAESMGQTALVPRHMGAVTQLLLEINGGMGAAAGGKLPALPDFPDDAFFADAA